MKKELKLLRLLLSSVFVLFVLNAGFGETGNNDVASMTQTPEPEHKEEQSIGPSSGQVIKSLLTILFVLGVLIAVNVYIKKRTGGITGLGGARIRVLERRAIDTKRILLLVGVDGKNVLIGVGPQQISTLCEFDADRVGPADATPHGGDGNQQ